MEGSQKEDTSRGSRFSICIYIYIYSKKSNEQSFTGALSVVFIVAMRVHRNLFVAAPAIYAVFRWPTFADSSALRSDWILLAHGSRATWVWTRTQIETQWDVYGQDAYTNEANVCDSLQ